MWPTPPTIAAATSSAHPVASGGVQANHAAKDEKAAPTTAVHTPVVAAPSVLPTTFRITW